MSAFTAAGRWRVYFNRHGAASLPWCVAPDVGGWELAVASVSIEVPCSAVYQPKATSDDEDGRPSAWFRMWGRLEVCQTGTARIRALDGRERAAARLGDRVRVVRSNFGWTGSTGRIVLDLHGVEGREANPWNVQIDGVPEHAPHLGRNPVIALGDDEIEALTAPSEARPR